MEEPEEDRPGVQDALAFEEEHERLASQYQNETVLLERALKASTNSSRTSSPEPERSDSKKNEDESGTSSLKSRREKIPELRQLVPLQPIPRSRNKPSPEDDEAPPDNPPIKSTASRSIIYYIYKLNIRTSGPKKSFFDRKHFTSGLKILLLQRKQIHAASTSLPVCKYCSSTASDVVPEVRYFRTIRCSNRK